MVDIPRLALSIRQPWAWAVASGAKDIENRSWRQPNPGLQFRGQFAVHASKGMTRDEYEDAADTMKMIGVKCPSPAELLRGGIVGIATIFDIVKESESPWFFGPRGLVISEAMTIDFIPAGGQLGFFAWKPMDASEVPEPAKWMREYGIEREVIAPTPELFSGPMESPLERAKRRAGA